MADGFIVRRGGKATEQALAPTITEVSVTDSSITFTIKNEDTEKAIIRYRIDDIDAEGEIIELAGGATSSNITASELDDDTTFTVFATANVTGKVKSNVSQLAITTDKGIVFTAATGGTTLEYDDGGKRYRSHTFTSDGNFVVTTVGNDDRNKVDYLIIAGGGGGGLGGGGGGGGGGAGGYQTSLGASGADTAALPKFTVTATTFGVVIGSGGAAATTEFGGNGTNSSVFSIASTGGGGGGGFESSGLTGGSGGGGGGARTGETPGSGGAGTSLQGTSGGTGGIKSFEIPGAGGGGSKDAGANATGTAAGKGGDGLANLLRTGSNETRAGGGGGAIGTSGEAGSGTPGTGADGGAGGGGRGAIRNVRSAIAGTANTGSGGGGGSNSTHVSAAGGDGIVIIRYEIAPTV
jgi:hypothetical protein